MSLLKMDQPLVRREKSKNFLWN